MEHVHDLQVLALDLEGTLISNAMSQIARPGLRKFLDFCGEAFPRVVIYTSIPENHVRRKARILVNQGSAPEWFVDVEYIEWDGKIKDLRFIPGAEPEEIILIDDHEAYIHPRQRQQWIKIQPFETPYPVDDRELFRIRLVLERMSASAAPAQGEGVKIPGKRQQAAAIPYRITDAGPEVLLVTSTSSGKWILPKGNIDAGSTPAQTAEIEAREEAGVVGLLWPEPVGDYDYVKESVRLSVVAFPLMVDRVLATWPESRLRSRRWTSLAEAARLVAEPGVRAVLKRFAEWLQHRA